MSVVSCLILTNFIDGYILFPKVQGSGIRKGKRAFPSFSESTGKSVKKRKIRFPLLIFRACTFYTTVIFSPAR
ncbi:Uncharacterized protein dnm_094430 [Desulfonema magnum]|uniref:Uncharacterized protein n=1 Tax=Desulfonema magnum TaxID=45655 RepID=A0A975GTU2_9BACT|nr:Uncharacterized protein dnm_094430 [Desulfonema magnum]